MNYLYALLFAFALLLPSRTIAAARQVIVYSFLTDARREFLRPTVEQPARQSANAVPLYLGLVPDEKIAQILAGILADGRTAKAI